jgi:hypothetical protein
MKRTAIGFAFLVGAACGGAPAPESSVPVGAGTAMAQEAGNGWHESLEMPRSRPLPPAGFGTLSQDDITIPVDVSSDNLAIKVTPLTEWVISRSR